MDIRRLVLSTVKIDAFVGTVDYPDLSVPNDFRRMLAETNNIRQVVRSESPMSRWLVVKNESQLKRLEKFTGKIEHKGFPMILTTTKDVVQWRPVTLSKALQKLRHERMVTNH